MYVEFMKDPEANSVRVLSQKYHVSMKRVDAILRLKGMEAAWVKVRNMLSSIPPRHQTGRMMFILYD